MGQTIATNKKAFQNYFLTEQRECGVALAGCEVKSIRAGNVNFKDSFARIDGEELYLYNLHIDPYPQASYFTEEPDRRRKLLLHKKELKRLAGTMTQRGLTLIPTKIYFNDRGFVKVEVAIGRGKKQYDKREDIKKRDVDREISRAVRSRQG